MKPLVLIIDDDAKLNALLGTYLADFGMRTVAAVTPADGLRELHAHRPDLVILDVMLPGMSGFDLCRTIRRTDSVPIIMLTARGEVADRIVGLELGADDYLPKPFEPRELVARIQSVLRRPRAAEREVRRFGALVVDLARRQATLDGAPVELTTNEFEVLRLLTDHPGEVLDRDRILETLRGIEHEAFNRTVDVTVSRLRQKLGDDPKAPRFIRTVWGAGYVFIAPETQQEGGDDGSAPDRSPPSAFTRLLLVFLFTGLLLNLLVVGFFAWTINSHGVRPADRQIADYVTYLVGEIGDPPSRGARPADQPPLLPDHRLRGSPGALVHRQGARSPGATCASGTSRGTKGSGSAGRATGRWWSSSGETTASSSNSRAGWRGRPRRCACSSSSPRWSPSSSAGPGW